MLTDRAPSITRALIVACAAAASAVGSLSAADAPAGFDAALVSMSAPDRLLTDQVFSAQITLKNTGSESWKEGPNLVILFAQEPAGNQTWGTHKIVLSQGKTIAPGESCTFSSRLKAPGEAGEHVFCWRLRRKQGQRVFGEASDAATITVEPRPERAQVEASWPAPSESGKQALTREDFIYLGSVKLPSKVGHGGGGFSRSGIALRIMPDGERRLLVNYTHPGQTLFAVALPELVALGEDGSAASLNTARVTTQWGALRGKGADRVSKPNSGDIYFDNQTGIVYWTMFDPYWTGGSLPVLGAAELGDDGSTTPVGAWTVSRQKHHWGGVTILPEGFAARHTGGRRLALGFGGYYSIVAPCSRGPALGAIHTPDPSVQRVDPLPLLAYFPHDRAAPRNGDYFSANCGFWNDPPAGPEHGTWTFTDHVGSGVFIDLPDKHGYITFVRLGTGRLGYDYGKITAAGRDQYWYFYDPVQLGEVAEGQREAALTPYLMAEETRPGVGRLVRGFFYDAATPAIYTLSEGAYKRGPERHPLVHAYRIRTDEDR